MQVFRTQFNRGGDEGKGVTGLISDRLRIFMIRHGETEWNNLYRYQGITDVPLSLTGRRQAEMLAKRLSDTAVNRIYSSDLARASETADIIASRIGVTVEEDRRLREMCFGVWEGMPILEVKERWGDFYSTWRRDPSLATPPDGESAEDIKKRCRSWLEHLRSEFVTGDILVVAHGAVLRYIISELMDLPTRTIWMMRMDNASVSIVDIWRGQPMLALFNDVVHLHSNILGVAGFPE